MANGRTKSRPARGAIMVEVRRELIIDFAELSCIEARCKCGQVTLMSATADYTRTALKCSGCDKPFSDMFLYALRSFREAYKNFGVANGVSAHVRIPFNEAS
jgi:hypothetical protein